MSRRRYLACLAMLYVPAGGVLAVIATVSLVTDISVGVLTRDPSAVMKAHPLVGVLSNLGVLLWCASASVSVFVGVYLVYGRFQTTTGWFLIVSGVITSALLVDDFWSVHEDLASRWLGWDERPFFVAYGLAILMAGLRFRQTILRTPYWLLMIALGFFASSLALDMMPYFDRLGDWGFLAEDGFKFLGIVGWSGYFIQTCFQQLTRLPIATSDA